LDDPLTVVVLRSLGLPTILGMALTALRSDADAPAADAGGRRKAVVVRDVVSATARARTSVPYQMDGEPLGDAEGLSFGWEPASLRLVVPGH
jgi:diacylglycerol kinase family enzyme